MVNTNVNKKIFRNLILGGIVISIFVSIIVWLVEYSRIDDYVARLAVGESVKYSKYYSEYSNNPSAISLFRLRSALQNAFGYDLFIFVEIYDADLTKIIDENKVGVEGLRADLDQRFSDFAMNGKVAHQKVLLRGQFYIKVMSPIRDQGNEKIIGHFEGVYHVSDDKIAVIKEQMLLSVSQAVLIVLLTAILFYPIILQLNKKLYRLSYELLESNIDTIKSLGSAIAKRDNDTESHNYRVAIYSVRLAEKLGMDAPEIQSLLKGAFLHDIGKIGISDTILLKPGRLTSDEFAIMKEHVVLGMEIIENNKWLIDARDVVLSHHEKFDGSGYPQGLYDEKIPVNAKIFAIADVFDALTSSRPYKEAYSFEKAMGILREGAGSHFDPIILGEFEMIACEMYGEMSHLKSGKLLNENLDNLVSRYFTLVD